ncbi:MAG: aminotransferase class III-fold pyridoxal phosphate-dependent enzyme, partial [Rhodospirillales bacterium]|nr:aminotransferase class III-fold pyridoxal phosphate-dependent enzyme [Rhodospirillales bacterium]
MITPVMPTYGQPDLAFERGEGVYVYAADGKRYLDFGGGIAVTALGHCHPHLVEALKSQADKLWHCSNLYEIPEQKRLAERLVEASFADSVFFNNSGAEAVETSLKMARKYHDAQGNPERYRVITVEGAFHGRSLATIAAGGQEKHLKGFG